MPFGKVMVYLAVNCNLNARRVVARCFHNGIRQPVAGKPSAVPKFFATREDLSRKSTVPRELVADYWMEGL